MIIISDERVDDPAIVGDLGCVGEHIKVWEAASVAMMVVIGDEPSTSMSYRRWCRRFLSVVENAF